MWCFTPTGLYDRVETQPGISVYADDGKALEALSLEPLLGWARAVVPPRQHRCTPVFMLATAGVRKLRQEQQAALMSNAAGVLQRSGFR